TADVLTEATAEFAFFMMGMLARKMWQSERLVREQKWPSWHPFLPFLGDEVTGKTIAVIGTGRIGLAMIKKCSGFDMNILCYDPVYQNEKFVAAIQELMDLRHARGIQNEKTWIKYVEFEEALRGADYVTIHVPLLREGETDKPTYHLINEQTLKLMKPTAYLINSSRGPVVDEKALAKALKEKVIAGAALDVFEKEPLPPDSPLLNSEIADRCRVFHHFASGARITRLDVDSILRWRYVGPYRGGRTRAIAGVPSQPNVFYMAPVNGGVFKSADYGRTWRPIFDDQPTASVGAIAVAPANPNVVYVGSGEGLHRPDLSVGDGIYKSIDAGKTWTHLGLRDGQQIAQLAVDPKNADRFFVAVAGHPYGPNEERGVFRSLDGGTTFERVLYRDENVGASDVQIDPRDPAIVYAALWESREG